MIPYTQILQLHKINVHTITLGHCSNIQCPLQSDSTLHPFQAFSTSGPLSFSPTFPLPFYNLAATDFGFPPTMSDPLPSPSSGRATYNPFRFSSSASDTYILTAAMSKGKAPTIIPSLSHTITSVSVPHIPTSTYRNGVTQPLPLFLPPLSSPRFAPPNTPRTFHTPSSYPLSPSFSTHTSHSPHSPLVPRPLVYASPHVTHTSTHSIAHPTPIYTPPVTPHHTPIPLHTPCFTPAHPTPLCSPFVPLPPHPPLPLVLGAAAPLQPLYTCSFKSDLPDLSKISILSSGVDWTAWNWTVLDLLDNLCLFRHITSPSPPGVHVTSLVLLSYPSTLDDDPIIKQLAHHDAWWRADRTVWHILWGHLGPASEALVPLHHDAFGNVAVSSCDLYTILVARYGGGDHGTASEVKDKLRALYCGTGKDAVSAFFVMTWWGALCQLDNTPWNFTEFECICTFMDWLPLTEAFCMLCEHVDSGFSIMPPIFPAFENLAIGVLTIDTQNCRLTALHSSSSIIPHRSAAPSSTATTAPASTNTSSA